MDIHIHSLYATTTTTFYYFLLWKKWVWLQMCSREDNPGRRHRQQKANTTAAKDAADHVPVPPPVPSVAAVAVVVAGSIGSAVPKTAPSQAVLSAPTPSPSQASSRLCCLCYCYCYCYCCYHCCCSRCCCSRLHCWCSSCEKHQDSNRHSLRCPRPRDQECRKKEELAEGMVVVEKAIERDPLLQ